MRLACWLFGHKWPITTLLFVRLRGRCVRCGLAYWWHWTR